MAYRKCSACDLRHPPGQHVARLADRPSPTQGQPPPPDTRTPGGGAPKPGLAGTDTTAARPGSGPAGPGRDSSPGSLGPGGPPGDALGLFGGGGGDPEPYGPALSESGAWYGYGGDDYADTFGGIASGSGQHYGPGASSYLNGAPEDPRAVGRELGGRRLSYQEWLELGHVYINGRRVEISDLPGLVSHGGGRSPAQVDADTERARRRIAGYLNAGADLGSVKAVAPVIEPKPPLSRERLGDTFILDGAKVETEGFFRLNADFHGGRSPAQVRQRKRLSDGLTIREMQEHYDQGRIVLLDAERNPEEKSGHVYYPLPSGDSIVRSRWSAWSSLRPTPGTPTVPAGNSGPASSTRGALSQRRGCGWRR